MDHNETEEFEDFSLEDILNEFHTEKPPVKPASSDTGSIPTADAAPHVAVNLEDTGPMAPLSSSRDLFFQDAPGDTASPEEASLSPSEEPADSGDILSDLPEGVLEEPEESPSQPSGADDLPELPEDAEDTKNLDTDELLSGILEDSPETDENADTLRIPSTPENDIQPPPGPIPFSSPHSRLRELKKKLVNGPEKRYYALSEAGIGKLQAAIFVNVLVVLLCAGVTTLFVLGAVPENRLRLVIFSQVLAMLISALMGCQLMLDAFIDLFKGKFTVNTLLTTAFFVCLADSWYCLQELRVPCCAAFCLSMTMALWARYERHTTEMARMDTMRKAVRLNGIVRKENYCNGNAGLLRMDAQVEDFMDTYSTVSGPEKTQNAYAFLSLLACIGIAVFAGLQHGTSMGVQILSTSLLVAVPASFFISISRPAAILEQRLHMVGAVMCGWQGVKALTKKAYFPLTDADLFPQGSTKLNGVKFYGSRNPDEVVSYTTSLICHAGGGLVPVFQHLLASRDGSLQAVEGFRNYGGGGIGGMVCGEPVLLGDMAFLRDMGVEIPEGTMVNQAVYAAIDGELCAVYAISYAKMRSTSAGLVTLSSYRKLYPIMACSDFMVTEEFIQNKFGIKTGRITFPDPDTRRALASVRPDSDAPVLAIATREELLSSAYAVTGSRALATATRLGVTIHLIGGILGMLIMLVLAFLGSTELLTPTNVLLYQIIWAVPGLLVTEWARAV